MGKRMTFGLVECALRRAIGTKHTSPGLIHHSDSLYCAHAYQEILRQSGLRPSMSRQGDCWGNAPMESHWATLKNELIYHRHFVTRDEAREAIQEYIEIFYNRTRKQARRGYLSPAAFTHKYWEQQMVA